MSNFKQEESGEESSKLFYPGFMFLVVGCAKLLVFRLRKSLGTGFYGEYRNVISKTPLTKKLWQIHWLLIIYKYVPVICIILPECINFVISIFQSAHNNMELILEAYSLNFANSLMPFLKLRKGNFKKKHILNIEEFLKIFGLTNVNNFTWQNIHKR